jgi:CubicO group peptidase (beta-lactamase class C family)
MALFGSRRLPACFAKDFASVFERTSFVPRRIERIAMKSAPHNLPVTLLLFSACVVSSARVVHARAAGPATQASLEASNLSLRAQLDEYISRITAFGFSGAVLVVRGDEVLVSRGCGFADRGQRVPNTPRTLFDIASVTKPITAIAVVKLASAGKLRLDDPIGKHFDSVPPDKAGITVHHLLTHTSGLPGGVGIVGEAREDRHAAVRQMLALPLEFKPGEQVLYSNTGFQLLGCLVEQVSGERFEDHLKRTVLRPAGMMRTGFIADKQIAGEPIALGYSPDYPDGIVGRADQQWYHWGLRGCGGILTSIEDLLQLERALRGGQLLTSEEKETLFKPRQKPSFPGGSCYGYGWQTSDEFAGIPTRYIGHGGDTRGFESKFLRFPDERLLIAILSNTNDHHSWSMPQDLLNIVHGRPFTMPPKSVELSRDALKRWEGEYGGPDGTGILIQADGNRLIATAVGQSMIERCTALIMPRFPGGPKQLEPADANRLADVAIRAVFERDLGKLDALLEPELEGGSRRLSDDLYAQASKRGGLVGHRVLGTTPAGLREPRTWVELRFSSGVERVGLSWNGKRIATFTFPCRADMGLSLVPQSQSRFVEFDIASSLTTTVDFERGGAGGPTHASVRFADGYTMRFTRVGD